MKALNKNTMAQLARFVFLLMIILPPAAEAASDFYQQQNLVSDGFVPANNTDQNLVNGWGVAFNPTGPVWVAANGTGTSVLFDGAGKPQPLVVQIPGPANASAAGTPTGIVFNASTEFVVSQGGASDASKFIFATEDGVIAAWSPNVDRTNAIRVVDNSTSTKAVYKGITLSADGNEQLLYATDFHNNKIDVFDSSFKPASLDANAFTDPTIPAGFAPFNIQAIDGDIYVTYAKQDAAKHDDVHGKGLGYVNVFDPKGTLIRRIVSQGELNAPWGIALAPAGFGKFGSRLLIGNFGDGMINAYDPATGDFLGKLSKSDGQPLQIDGLWGLAFGNGLLNQPVDSLFFAAGPNDEQHGLYGRIEVAPGNQQGATNSGM